MKKIFSTVAMAIVAFVSVVSMSSCSNDDSSSFNAAPSVEQQKTYNYSYKAALTSDILAYFDVTITRTSGTESKTFSFTEATKIGDNAAMQASDSFQSTTVGVKYKVNVTLKSNWKEIFEANGKKNPVLDMSIYVKNNYGFRDRTNGCGHVTEMSEEGLQNVAQYIANYLSNTTF